MLPMSIVATECMSGLRNADVCPATQPCQLRAGAHSKACGVLFGRFRLMLHYMLLFVCLDMFI